MYIYNFEGSNRHDYLIPVTMVDNGSSTVSGYNDTRPLIVPPAMVDSYGDPIYDRPARVVTDPATLLNNNYGIGKAIMQQVYNFEWTPLAASDIHTVTSQIVSPAIISSSVTRQYGVDITRTTMGARFSKFTYGNLISVDTADTNSFGATSNWENGVTPDAFEIDIKALGKAIYEAGYRSGRALIIMSFVGIAETRYKYFPDSYLRLLLTITNSGPGGATVNCNVLGQIGSTVTDDGLGYWNYRNGSGSLESTTKYFACHTLMFPFTIADAYNMSSNRSWTAEIIPCFTSDGFVLNIPRFPSIMFSVVAEDYS